MASPRPLIAVIGGGVSGLAAAWEINREGKARVVVLESSSRLGGTIASRTLDGVQVEQGPDAILSSPEIDGLIAQLGLGDDVVRPSIFGGLVATNHGLKTLPPSTVLGVPLRPAAAVASGLLSPIGGLRCWAERLGTTRLDGPDVALGPFVAQRFGHEVLEQMVDPLLAGSRAGDPTRMSLAAAAPQIDRAARSSRSVLRGLKKNRPEPASFLSFSGGLEMLTDRYATSIGAKAIRLGARVKGVTSRGKKFRIEGPEIDVDGVVVATPAHVSARLLSAWSGDLAGIDHASFAIATLVYEGDDSSLPGPGSGMLVPSSQGLMLSACTFYSRKWGTPAARGRTIVRAVAGRTGSPSWLGAPADQIALALDHDIKMLTHHELPLRRHVLKKLPRSLPQYGVGHLDLINEMKQALPEGCAIAGAFIRGTGIPDCIESGRDAARQALADVLG